MKKLKKNNRGYSLVELVIVIAVMAVLSGLLVTSVSILAGWDAKECAKDIEGHLNNVKTNALSKLGAELLLSRDADDNYIIEYVEYGYEKNSSGNLVMVPSVVTREYFLGKKKVSIVCILEDGTNITVSQAANISIGFNRSSGALTTFKTSDPSYTLMLDNHCESIEITRGSITYAINMVPETGKISMEKK
jgi:prepilin-type N-terminal cleavage/methylation domain-containing protein